MEELELCSFIRSYNACGKKQEKHDETLRNKKSAFVGETKTRKSAHITLITTYGLKRNEYWNNIQSEVTMDDLFA